ncbi:hypothetical protein BT63DRAFT_430203 [Microthyrium microscopicum]|uniref:RAD52 homolog n=1 Tax=Microthyrium microscopicum TaxID=703497 RepID=A0A6A6TX95_9PEZI|nr:hypothetical protein BT63DRAFT_430203 [Microthyrium microscopicum]
MPNPGDQYASIPNPFRPNEQNINKYTAQEIATLQSRLDRQLGPEYISTRPGPGGTKLSYITAEKLINLTNEVFGFNGWSSEIRNVHIDFVDLDGNGRVTMGCSIIVRITLKDGTFHEDIGYGEIKNSPSKAAAFEKTKKEASTDALKRTLRNFGNLLGNCLYDKTYTDKISKVKTDPIQWNADDLHRHHSHPAHKPDPPVQQPPAPVAVQTPTRIPAKVSAPIPAQNATSNNGALARHISAESANSMDQYDDEYGADDFEHLEFVHSDDIDMEESVETIQSDPRPPIEPIPAGRTTNGNQGPGPPAENQHPLPQQSANRGQQQVMNSNGARTENHPNQAAQNQQSRAQQAGQNQQARQSMQNRQPQAQAQAAQIQRHQAPQQGQSNNTAQRALGSNQQNVQQHNGNGSSHRPANANNNGAAGPAQMNGQNRLSGTPPARGQPAQAQNNAAQNPALQQANGTAQFNAPPVPVGFYSARVADVLNDEKSPLSAQIKPFDPHTPGVMRRTTGVNHGKSGPIHRSAVAAGTTTATTTNPANAGPNNQAQARPNVVNPLADTARRIGVPGGAGSPLANRTSYKLPGPALGKRGPETVPRQVMGDVSNTRGGVHTNPPEKKAKTGEVTGAGLQNDGRESALTGT